MPHRMAPFGALVVEPLQAVLLVGVVALLVAVGVLVTRWWRARLPLTVAPTVLRGRVDGAPAYQFRARLGRGRTMSRARATIRFEPEGGEALALEPLMAVAEVLVGPWTLVVVDRSRRCDGRGIFVVSLEVSEGGRTWSTEARFPRDRVREGRFAPSVELRGGRLRLAGDPFAVVEPPTSA